MRPVTPGGHLRPLTPGGSIQGKPTTRGGQRRPNTPNGTHLVRPFTPGGTFRPTTRGGTLVRASNLHEHTHDFNGNPVNTSKLLRQAATSRELGREPSRVGVMFGRGRFEEGPRGFGVTWGDAMARGKRTPPPSRGARRRARAEKAAEADAMVADYEARAEVDAAEAEVEEAAAFRVERKKRRRASRVKRQSVGVPTSTKQRRSSLAPSTSLPALGQKPGMLTRQDAIGRHQLAKEPTVLTLAGVRAFFFFTLRRPSS